MALRQLGRHMVGATRWRTMDCATVGLIQPMVLKTSPSGSHSITTSTSKDPRAPVVGLDPQSNPHATTPSATSILPQPTIHTTIAPSAFQLASLRSQVPPPPPVEPDRGPLPASVLSLLPSLAIQKPHYATVHIHDRPYLVTAGDRVRLPFRMPGVQLGDVLRLPRASVLGSRDFTLRGSPWVDDRCFVCRATVVGVEAEPMRFMEKRKQRNRRIKTVKSKHRYTELVISELTVRKLEDVMSNVS